MWAPSSDKTALLCMANGCHTDHAAGPMGHWGGLLLRQAVPPKSDKLVGTSLEGRDQGPGWLWEFSPHNTASTQMCISSPRACDLTLLKPINHHRKSELCSRKWFPCVSSIVGDSPPSRPAQDEIRTVPLKFPTFRNLVVNLPGFWVHFLTFVY